MTESAPHDLFSQRLRDSGATLAPAARRVAMFIDRNRAAALAGSAQDLAARTGTSDATVIRAVQALGFSGLGAVKQALLASLETKSTPADDLRRTLDEIGTTSDRAIDTVLAAHQEALDKLRAPIARAQMLAALSLLHVADRIVVFGIGPSAALADYAATLLRRTGRRTARLNTTGIMLADQLLDLRAGDALLILAYGRTYREVLASFAEAQRLGLRSVLITDTPSGKLPPLADAVLPIQRGRTQRMALHGATLVALEALILGLATTAPADAIATLDHLNTLRQTLTGGTLTAVLPSGEASKVGLRPNPPGAEPLDLDKIRGFEEGG